MKTKTNPFLILILSICIITPMANDMFIPALPEMKDYFNSQAIQYIVPIFMFGLALGQLICGPMLDRYGRKPILITGLVIFFCSSAIIILANNIQLLLVARFIQALGAACLIPATMAVARDSYGRERLAQVIPLIMGAIVIMPTIAPLFGSYLTAHFNWRANFLVLTIIAALYLVIISFLFHESMSNKNLDSLKLKKMLRNYKILLSHKKFISYVFTAGFSYGIMFGYIAISPFLLIHELHIPVAKFGWYFFLFAIVISIGSFSIPSLSKKWALEKLMLIGCSTSFVGAVLFLLVQQLFAPSIFTIVGPMFIISIGIGLLRPAAATSALCIFPANLAGLSSSAFNFLSFLLGTLSTLIVAQMKDTPANFSYLITIFATSSLLICLLAQKKRCSRTM
jgi:DHA1 family bicyclomycin/chloramphenicol resistance-like MFS transporter